MIDIIVSIEDYSCDTRLDIEGKQHDFKVFKMLNVRRTGTKLYRSPAVQKWIATRTGMDCAFRVPLAKINLGQLQ